MDDDKPALTDKERNCMKVTASFVLEAARVMDEAADDRLKAHSGDRGFNRDDKTVGLADIALANMLTTQAEQRYKQCMSAPAPARPKPEAAPKPEAEPKGAGRG